MTRCRSGPRPGGGQTSAESARHRTPQQGLRTRSSLYFPPPHPTCRIHGSSRHRPAPTPLRPTQAAPTTHQRERPRDPADQSQQPRSPPHRPGRPPHPADPPHRPRRPPPPHPPPPTPRPHAGHTLPHPVTPPPLHAAPLTRRPPKHTPRPPPGVPAPTAPHRLDPSRRSTVLDLPGQPGTGHRADNGSIRPRGYGHHRQ